MVKNLLLTYLEERSQMLFISTLKVLPFLGFYSCQVTQIYSSQFQNPQGSSVGCFFSFLLVTMCVGPRLWWET